MILKTEKLEAIKSNLWRRPVANDAVEQMIFFKILVMEPSINRKLARVISANVRHYAHKYGVDPNLVLAIIAVESKFDPRIVSSAGAIRLMQVMPQWINVLGIEGNPTDPEVSIKYGTQLAKKN